MRSKEVEEAIKNCNVLLAGDITVHIIDNDGGTAYTGEVNKTYNDDLKTVLAYIEQLEKKIPTPSNEVPVEYQTLILVDKRDAVMKSEIRDKIKELEKASDKAEQLNASATRYDLIQKLDNQMKILYEIIGE